ncbi:MAG: hypothetical protein WCC66_02645 [Rhizobiaceae bacterium]
MDWPLAINRNRDALRRIVAALFALTGLKIGGSLSTLPRHVYAAVMLVLRPAESAVRRLITLAAHGLVLQPQAPHAAPVGLAPREGSARKPAFALLDPLKQFDPDAIWDADAPMFIEVHGPFDPAFGFHEVPSSLAPVAANLLGLRLNALMRALDDLPRQARRLVRWQARRDLALAQMRPMRLSPIRPGPPPGKRQRPLHEVDDILRECHGLALDRLNAPDTS